MAASVRRRLLDAAQASGRPFQELLQYYAMERFLYRLAQSPHADRFVLKGALMFHAWRASTSRPTKDIDLLGYMENSTAALAAIMREVCGQPVEADGLLFDRESVAAVAIKEDADYAGVRLAFRGSLENARIAMRIDVGFGDVMYPGPEVAEYPTILDHSAPRLRGYPRETVVAEKFEAMVKLGLLNSRMKDFYDVWQLSRQFDFDGATLARAIERTFANRKTRIEPLPTALTPTFGGDASKQMQWRGFLKKTKLSDVPVNLQVVVDALVPFLSPVAAAIASGTSFDEHWQAPGPWR